MAKTRLSSTGRVILPKSVREAKGWREGDELLVEIVAEGVLARAPPTCRRRRRRLRALPRIQQVREGDGRGRARDRAAIPVIAIDTNAPVRLVTGDDRGQAARSQALFAAGRVCLAKADLLETERVLRSSSEGTAETTHDAFRRVLGPENVEVEDHSAVLHALDLCSRGVEFAVALHLVSAARAAEFTTFDTSPAKRAARLRTHPRVRKL